MSRKDYIALAAALASIQPPANDDPAAIVTWEACVTKIAQTLAYDNSRFDRDRFLGACGLLAVYA